MTNFLIKTFIKDSENTKNSKVREKYGILAGVVGIFVNVILFLMKLIIGSLTGSIAITADAFNNLSDATSSVISILGFLLSNKPPDKKHPFGYGRTEYLAGLFIAIIILMVGVEFAKTSFLKILNPENIEFSLVLMIILSTSVLAKFWLGLFNKNLGTKIDSTVLKATMQDSINDCITTSAVIIAMLISQFFNINIDGIMGLAVAIFILISGFNIIKDTISPLIGQSADPNLAAEIEKIIMQFDNILGVHDLIVHNYGADKFLASVHVEVPDTINFVLIHEIVDSAEKTVWEQTGVYIVIHMDPISMNDEKVNNLRELTKTILSEISDSLKMHDFRVVDGDKQINLIFDVVVPCEYREEDKIVSQISAKLKKIDKKLNPVVVIDHEM